MFRFRLRPFSVFILILAIAAPHEAMCGRKNRNTPYRPLESGKQTIRKGICNRNWTEQYWKKSSRTSVVSPSSLNLTPLQYILILSMIFSCVNSTAAKEKSAGGELALSNPPVCKRQELHPIHALAATCKAAPVLCSPAPYIHTHQSTVEYVIQRGWAGMSSHLRQLQEKYIDAIWYNMHEAIPELSHAEFNELYDNLKLVNVGSTHGVFKTTCRRERDGLEPGQALVLRVKRVGLQKRKRRVSSSLTASALLLDLKGITNYFPTPYAVYEMPYTERLKCSRTKGGAFVSVEEMPYFEKDYYTHFFVEKKESSARIVVEEVLGKWAASHIVGLSVDDADGDVLRHRMLTFDPRHLVLHIGDRTYLFPPGYSPRQIDFDDYYQYKSRPTTKQFSRSSLFTNSRELHRERVPNAGIKAFLDEVLEEGLLKAFYDNLKDFEVSEERPIPETPLVHLRISKENLEA